MNNHDLITVVASESGVDILDTERVIESLSCNISRALKFYNEVKIYGFGTFRTLRQNKTDGNGAGDKQNPMAVFEPFGEFLSLMRS